MVSSSAREKTCHVGLEGLQRMSALVPGRAQAASSSSSSKVKDGAASRDQHIQILVHSHKFCSSLSACVGKQLNRIFCDSALCQSGTDRIHDRLIGMDRITAAAQNHCVAGFKAKCKCICCYVRSCFVNNTDYAHRHTFLTDHKSVRALFHRNHFTDRVFQSYDLTRTFHNTVNTRRCEKKAVYQALCHSLRFCSFNIFCIGCQNFILLV